MDEIIIDLQKQIQNDCSSRVAIDSVYAGDPGLTEKAALPAVIISEGRTDLERQQTGSDVYKFNISILVITDISSSMSIAGNPDRIMKARQALRQLIEQADPNAGAPMTDTILGSLMKQSNISTKNWRYNIKPSVNYRPNTPKEWWYACAEITLSFISDIVIRTL
jgi:hypothetical protein